MTDQHRRLTVSLDADTSRFRAQMADATRIGERFGNQLTSAFLSIAKGGASLEDQMRKLALSLSNMALKAAFRPLENAIGNAVGQVAGGLFSGASSSGSVLPFARGGVVNGPAMFPLSGNRTGLMGEAGPEAIMPLARGADGRLGVRASAGSNPVTITFNVTSPDADSFMRSQSQISAMLARAVRQGGRNL